MGTKILLRGGTVLTMDPAIGDLARGDVLIEDDKIAAVEHEIERRRRGRRRDRQHRHPRLRRHPPAHVGGGDPRLRAERHARRLLRRGARHVRARSTGPRTCYASNLAGSLECLNAGITTLVDWSHINNTPEHPDAGDTGLQETGIRAQYAYGSANTSLADYWFDSKIAIPGDDVRRIRDTYFSSDGGLLTMGLATRGPGFCQERGRAVGVGARPRARHPDHRARGDGPARRPVRHDQAAQRLGLLGPDTTYIHCCYFSDEEWQLVADSGGKISIAPQVEVQMGHGWPPVAQGDRATACGRACRSTS